MEKRLILAIAFSIMIIVAFQYLGPKAPPSPTTEVFPTGTTQAIPAITGKEPTVVIEPAVDEKTLTVQTDKFILTFSNVGGSLKEIRLKDYKDLKTNEPLLLAESQNPASYIFALSGVSPRIALDKVAYDVTTRDGAVIYSATVGGMSIVKRYVIHKYSYNIELQLFIKNISDATQDVCYRIISGSGLVEKTEQDKALIETTSKIAGVPVKFKRAKPGETIINSGTVDWTVIKSKYFSLIFKPLTQTRGEFYTLSGPGAIVAGVESDLVSIPPSKSIESKFILFAGPSHIPVLKEAGYDFEETVNYGFFGSISKALLATLRVIQKVVRSWGVAIILLSILLNVITLPLTMKSFKSMQKMQELHPQMEKLKQENKNNPQKLNKEVMELYKKYKINPLSGCLPMLLQMPIFIALYQALTKSLELRSANFLWIKDLSSPDAVPLPFTLPLIGNSINILPLIMVAAMVLQQKISTRSMGGAVTDEQKQQQKMMLIIMPVMFGFIFYNMPSGLVLYWVVNTTLTIIEQGAILKKA